MKLKKITSRKKSDFNHLDDYHDEEICTNDEKGLPIQRNTANARERARMRVLSSAFYRLKTIIPWVPHDTKLSKLDTLRLARNYIAYLSATLDGQPINDIPNNMPHPQKMTWPYIFQVPELSDFNLNNNSAEIKNNEKRKTTLQSHPDDDLKNLSMYDAHHSISLNCPSDSDNIYE